MPNGRCKLHGGKSKSRYGNRDATMILIGYRHGLRASELCDLQWSQVELTTGRLHVGRPASGGHSASRSSPCGRTNWTVIDSRQNSPDGLDNIVKIERLRFGDAEVGLGYSSEGATDTIFDTASVQPWNYLLYGYDAQSRLDYIQVGYDSGSWATVDYDQANAQAWSYVRYDYDALSRLDYIQVGYDGGARTTVDYDHATAQTWNYVRSDYDAQNRLDYIQIGYHSGLWATVDYDQTNAQVWSYVRYDYDAQNRLDYVQVGYDDGSRTTVDHDQANAQAWSYVRSDYDAQNRLDYIQVGYDDGSLVVIDYDQANTADWSYIYYTYGSQNALVSTLVHRDDGTDSFAAGPLIASTASVDNSSQIQLVQAMAGFGGGSGAGESFNSPPNAETSQQSVADDPARLKAAGSPEMRTPPESEGLAQFGPGWARIAR
jgi:hypothetical protein